MKYFIMAIHPQSGYPMPIVDEDDRLTLFDSEEEIIDFASHHTLCKSVGYEFFEWEYVN